MERVKFRERVSGKKEDRDRTRRGRWRERERGREVHALLDSEKPVPELVTGQFNPGR